MIKTMKRFVLLAVLFAFCMIMPTFASTIKKYYVKFMSRDYSNWIYSELKDVKSCTKTSDGQQYIIVYTGVDGAKTPFCESLCPIRKCAKEKNYETCGKCGDLMSCEKIKMIIDNNEKALKNLGGGNNEENQ